MLIRNDNLSVILRWPTYEESIVTEGITERSPKDQASSSIVFENAHRPAIAFHTAFTRLPKFPHTKSGERVGQSGLREDCDAVFSRGMDARERMKKIRRKVRRALRSGQMPLEIAKKLNLPLLLIAEIAVWEATIRHSSGTNWDL
jgi:hypothetical protein